MQAPNDAAAPSARLDAAHASDAPPSIDESLASEAPYAIEPPRETRADIDALAARLAARQAPQQAAAQHKPRAPRAPVAPFTPQLAHCEIHGPHPLNTVDPDGTVRWHPPGCPACRRHRAAQSLLARADIAARFSGCSFDTYIADTDAQRANLAACRDYAERFDEHAARGRCLILRGAPGTGKNHLATAIARVLLARGRTVLNGTAHELVGRIRATWRHAGDGAARTSEAALLREFAALDLLIIDEAGRTHENREGREPIELFHLIDARYRAVKPTLVISNLEREHLAAALGHAAFDRLREGGGRLLNFDWDSHRGGASAQAPLPNLAPNLASDPASNPARILASNRAPTLAPILAPDLAQTLATDLAPPLAPDPTPNPAPTPTLPPPD